MRDILNQFVNDKIGHFIEVSNSGVKTDQSILYQCMDLVYDYLTALRIPKSTIQHQYAYQVYEQANDLTRQYFDIFPNTPEFIPQEGDIAVFKGGKAGHIGIVIDATKTKITHFFDQNKPLLTWANIGEESYTNCLGFLRPKVKLNEPLIPEYLKTLAQESGIDINNESAVRAFWEKGRKYDDETATLRKQVADANERLAEKSNELATEINRVNELKDELGRTQEKLAEVGGARDKATWEATQLNLQVEAKVEEIEKLYKRISALEDTKKYQVILTWKDYQIIKKV